MSTETRRINDAIDARPNAGRMRYRKEIEALRQGLRLTYSEAAIARYGEAALVARDAEGFALMRDADAQQAAATAAHYRAHFKDESMGLRFDGLAAESRKKAAKWRRIAAVARLAKEVGAAAPSGKQET